MGHEAGPVGGSTEDEVDGAIAQLDAGLAAGRWLARGGDGTVPPAARLEAAANLIEARATLREAVPVAIDNLVSVAYRAVGPDDAEGAALRAEARAGLVARGLATERELGEFPEGSMRVIAQQRFLDWEETGETGVHR